MSEWNHNTIYHNKIIRNLSKSKNKALDIGSGIGLFSEKLSSLFIEVDSLEPDKESTLMDLLISLIAIIPNFTMKGITKAKENNKMITTFPDMTIKDIKKK